MLRLVLDTNVVLDLFHWSNTDAVPIMAALEGGRIEFNADGRQGVWRGPQFIALDKTLYEALRTLFLLGGAPSPEALIRMAGNPTNLNTLMSRLRAKVEPRIGPSESATGASRPKSGQPSGRSELYIHNRRDLGYWLENFIPLT